MSDHTNIAVLEGKWWRGWNNSVRTTFDVIAEMRCDDAHAYHYEMANSLAAFDEALPRIAKDTKCRYLCISTHGNPDGLELFNEDIVTIQHLRELILRLPNRSKFRGLYVDACSTGGRRLADDLFGAGVDLAWIAGYRKDVDFLKGLALNMLFFEALLSAREMSDAKAIRHVANTLSLSVAGLIEELGFGIFVQSRGDVVDLLAESPA